MRKNKSEIKEVITDISETREILFTVEEMDKFLEIYKYLKRKRKEIGNLNRPSKSQDVATVIKNLPKY